jgi:hypothetical protein
VEAGDAGFGPLRGRAGTERASATVAMIQEVDRFITRS